MRNLRSFFLPGPEKVMGRCLIASLLVHASMLAGIQEVVPWQWPAKPLRTFRVDLIRPPMGTLGREDTGGTELAPPKSLQKPAEDAEETISLDTQDVRYSSYAGVIKAILERHWIYPEEAKENLLEGRTQVFFRLNRDGSLLDLSVVEGSGHRILDREALAAIRNAAPFPQFPGSVTAAKLNIRATFDYRLTARRP